MKQLEKFLYQILKKLIKPFLVFLIYSGYIMQNQMKRSIENYNNSGKIYVTNTGKIIQTLLSFLDLVRLSLIKGKDHHRYKEHQLINEEIDLNERL